jgi:hypothetical protein
VTDISTGSSNSDLYQTKREGPLLQKELPSLPGTTIPGPVATAVTTETMKTADSARYFSVTHSSISLYQCLSLSAVSSTCSSPFPPAPLYLARPEQEGNHVAPSRVSNSSRSGKHYIIRTYGGIVIYLNQFYNPLRRSDISDAYSDQFLLCKNFPEHIGREDGTAPDPVALLYTVQWQICV